jgi:hypothetical protein
LPVPVGSCVLGSSENIIFVVVNSLIFRFARSSKKHLKQLISSRGTTCKEINVNYTNLNKIRFSNLILLKLVKLIFIALQVLPRKIKSTTEAASLSYQFVLQSRGVSRSVVVEGLG